ncbi:MAG: hypothetical protein WC601_08715 [Desulfotomaculaceae bacterium]
MIIDSHYSEADLCKYRRENVGFIFQAYYLIPNLSALKNVMVPAPGSC